MSKSQHPIALRLERQVGGDTRLLATVMGLPLADGIFPALVLAGVLDTVGGILQVGLLVFSGSATLAVIVAEMEGSPRDRLRVVAPVGAGLVAVAVAEAALAPTIAGVLDLATFERFAALVILAVAAKTASARVGEVLPRPAVIVGLGLIASVDPSGASLVVTLDPALVAHAGAAAGVGAGFALAVAALAPTLRGVVDLDRFRFGSAVALGMLPLGLVGFIPGDAPLAVLAVTALLAFDPGDIESSAPVQPAADGGEDVSPDGDPDRYGSGEGRLPWL